MTDDIKTIQDAAKHLKPFIDHLAEGGSMDDIQESDVNAGSAWDTVCDGHLANTHGVVHGYRYRFKPKQVERWGLMNCEGGLYKGKVYSARKEAERWFDHANRSGLLAPYRIVHLREVTDE